MNLQPHYEQIEEDGFTVIPNLISAFEAAEMKAKLKSVMEEDRQRFGGRPGKLEELVVDLLPYGREFELLLENDTMHEVFGHFLGDQCTMYCFNSAIMPPQRKTLACSIHVDTNFYVPNYFARLQLMLALDDITLENGATYFLPGSHKSEHVPTEQEFYENAVQLTRSAGDAVFFHTRCYHAGAENRTETTRYAIGLQACRPWMKQRLDFPRKIPREVVDRLSDRARRFVGLHSRVPVDENEFYVAPEQRLYTANLGQPGYSDPAVAVTNSNQTDL